MKKGQKGEICLFYLPELVLESIFERLSPAELCKLSKLCTFLRKICRSDHLWKKLTAQKWGRLIGSDDRQFADSIMEYYLSLESGKLWFAAQVFGRPGYDLPCYDAQVCYNHRSDNFQVRYLPGNRWRTSEIDVPWDRLRKPPMMDMPPDCINDLKPGDHIETLWSDSIEGPFGWWYGKIGHLDSCDQTVENCRCQHSNNLIVEFKQYPVRSIYRRVTLNKKGYRETGILRDLSSHPNFHLSGYYGKIRRLVNEEEIARWKTFLPALFHSLPSV